MAWMHKQVKALIDLIEDIKDDLDAIKTNTTPAVDTTPDDTTPDAQSGT